MTKTSKSPGACNRRGFQSHEPRQDYSSSPPSLDKIEAALRFIPSDDREAWIKIGMALKSELGEGGFDTWDTWSQSSEAYKERDTLAVWKSFTVGKVGIGSLFYLAQQNGWRWTGGNQELTADQLAERGQAKRACKAARAKEQADIEARHAKAAAIAAFRWERAKPCGSHPYLERKRVKPHGLRVGTWHKSYKDEDGKWHGLIIEDALLVPLFDEAGKLWSLQAIYPGDPPPPLEKNKDFLAGGRKAGLFFTIGEPTDTVLIAEGYATAATVHEATGHQTFVAFDCGNLKAIAIMVRKWLPEARIIICADNDRDTKGNPGVVKAREAALAMGGLVSIPEFPEGVEGTDWNDLHIYQLGLSGQVRHG